MALRWAGVLTNAIRFDPGRAVMRSLLRLRRVFPPYALLARNYDEALGRESFRYTRRAFECLARNLGVRFSSAADVGCGTGLFACYLRRCWRVPVFGVDRSPAMLRIAMRNCCGVGVRLLQQDLRSLHLPVPVDLITANFDTVNHLITHEDLGRALRCIRENLRPGGHFIFDFVTHCQPLAGARSYLRLLRGARSEVHQWIRWDPRRRALSSRVVHFFPSSAPPVVELHRERAYTPEEMGRALMDAGFVVRGVHDAISLRPAASCVPRLFVVAQKPPAGRCIECRFSPEMSDTRRVMS